MVLIEPPSILSLDESLLVETILMTPDNLRIHTTVCEFEVGFPILMVEGLSRASTYPNSNYVKCT